MAKTTMRSRPAFAKRQLCDYCNNPDKEHIKHCPECGKKTLHSFQPGSNPHIAAMCELCGCRINIEGEVVAEETQKTKEEPVTQEYAITEEDEIEAMKRAMEWAEEDEASDPGEVPAFESEEVEDPQALSPEEVETLKEEVEQLALAPAEPPTIRQETIRLDAFPPNEDLDAPTPGASFMKSVATIGVLVPINVKLAPNREDYVILDGRRRIIAARAAGFETIDAMVVYSVTGWEDETILPVALNHQRSENLQSDFHRIQKLKNQGLSPNDIYLATGMTPQKQKRLLRLEALNPVLQQGVSQGKIAQSVAEAAAKLPASRQEALVSGFEEKGRVTAEDVHKARTVQTQAAASALALDDILLPTAETNWKEEGSLLIQQLGRLVPGDAPRPVKNALTTLGRYFKEEDNG